MIADDCGYIKIARELRISENTVKSFCRRKRLNGAADMAVPLSEWDKSICPCSGADARQNPGCKVKKFSSDKCNNKWWNSYLVQVERKANYEFVCACCKSYSWPIAMRAGNTAAMYVMKLTGSEAAWMSKEKFRNEKMYHATMNIAKNLLEQGGMTAEEYD